jgi:hypothetical protein
MSFFIPETTLFQNQRHKISPPDDFFNFGWGLFLLQNELSEHFMLRYFKILTNASIRTLEWLNILTNRIK